MSAFNPETAKLMEESMRQNDLAGAKAIAVLHATSETILDALSAKDVALSVKDAEIQRLQSTSARQAANQAMSDAILLNTAELGTLLVNAVAECDALIQQGEKTLQRDNPIRPPDFWIMPQFEEIRRGLAALARRLIPAARRASCSAGMLEMLLWTAEKRPADRHRKMGADDILDRAMRLMEALADEAFQLRGGLEGPPAKGGESFPAAATVSPETTPDAPIPPTAQQQELLPEMLSATDLARHLETDPVRVEPILRRYRGRHVDCFREVEGPRRNEAKYLYRVADVLPHLKQALAKG